MKICAKCKIEKEFINFGIKKSRPDGLYNYCKSCVTEINQKDYNIKREEIIQKNSLYYEKNKEKILTERKESGKNSVRSKEWRLANPKKYLDNKKAYRIKNADKLKIENKEYKSKNKVSINARKKEYNKDPLKRLAKSCRERTRATLKSKSFSKSKKFEQYLGCTAQEAVNFIASQFKEGMSWDNHGLWEIDHKIALNIATTPEQVYALCHFSNLQPLWLEENRSKSDKLEYQVRSIDSKETHPFLLEIHYAKKVPNISYAFGLYLNDCLVGVVTYGVPASPTLRSGIAGEEYKGQVYELNRLCLKYNNKNEASMLVGRSLKLLPKNLFIVSFADTAQDHVGYVYQATNFGYYGLSANRKEWALKSNDTMHSMTIADQAKGQENKVLYLKNKHGNDLYTRHRSRKHRYIYVTGNNKQMMQAIKYIQLSYPKKSQ